ncbi:MAG: methionine synthase [Promethearchaeota archaeon]
MSKEKRIREFAHKQKQIIQDNKKMRIILACIGQCVHVAGICNFMNIAKQIGYECIFLGPATPISKIISEIKEKQPEIIGLSYRLTPKTLRPLLKEFFNSYNKLQFKSNRLFFGGTQEVIEVAKEFKAFNSYFVGGESKFRILSILRENQDLTDEKEGHIPMDLISRIQWKKPYPILRAHFGLSDFEDTLEGISTLAESEVLDVISIAPDQNTQENLFHPEKQIRELSGAGGVPLRSKDDFIQLDKARLRGNFPMLRIYAGTRDFIKSAKLFQKTIKNAWAAIPIFWFNKMDGRGPLPLGQSIKQHLEAIKWHGENKIPVEINDPHHWSLRDAPDAVSVADMYLCGIIAKNLGVKHFIAQYMFNTPPACTYEMDLAKIYAMDDLLNRLIDENFCVIKQVRTGLASFPLNLSKAKGHLAAATMIQLSIKPDIVHVVTHSEARHAAHPQEIIESCNIVNQVIDKMYASNINFIDKRIERRKEELIKQAKWIVDIIPRLARSSSEKKNPWINYKVLNRIVKYGVFDAPHLKNSRWAKGEIETRIIDGACYSWDSRRQRILNEEERIMNVLENCPYEIFENKLKYKSKNKEVMY